MIIFASLIRTIDGIPLSATTDDFNSDANGSIKEGKKFVKLISKQLPKYPHRVCLQTDEITLHCVSTESVSFLVVCEPNYPHILAYSFLDELNKEFSLLYTSSVVASVRRPYAFIEFDVYLQKVRQKYNSPRSLAARLNLQEMTTDLNLHPPTYLKKEDLEPPPNILSSSPNHKSLSINMSSKALPNGLSSNKDITNIGVVRLKPITWYGRIAITISLFLTLLDFYRCFLIFHYINIEDQSLLTPMHAFFFFLEGLFLSAQSYLLTKFNRLRKVHTITSFCVICILNIFMYDFRELWVIVLYILTSSLLTLSTFRRTFERIRPNFNV